MDASACNRFAPANSILVEGLSMNKGFDSRLNQGWRASARMTWLGAGYLFS